MRSFSLLRSKALSPRPRGRLATLPERWIISAAGQDCVACFYQLSRLWWPRDTACYSESLSVRISASWTGNIPEQYRNFSQRLDYSDLLVDWNSYIKIIYASNELQNDEVWYLLLSMFTELSEAGSHCDDVIARAFKYRLDHSTHIFVVAQNKYG